MIHGGNKGQKGKPKLVYHSSTLDHGVYRGISMYLDPRRPDKRQLRGGKRRLEKIAKKEREK